MVGAGMYQKPSWFLRVVVKQMDSNPAAAMTLVPVHVCETQRVVPPPSLPNSLHYPTPPHPIPSPLLHPGTNRQTTQTTTRATSPNPFKQQDSNRKTIFHINTPKQRGVLVALRKRKEKKSCSG